MATAAATNFGESEMACLKCNDTGDMTGQGYLDCVFCDVAENKAKENGMGVQQFEPAVSEKLAAPVIRKVNRDFHVSRNKQILKQAVRLFPRTNYTPDSAVRHARRQWLRCVAILRSGQRSKWVMDRSAELAASKVAS